jgi:hypothetical protein
MVGWKGEWSGGLRKARRYVDLVVCDSPARPIGSNTLLPYCLATIAGEIR